MRVIKRVRVIRNFASRFLIHEFVLTIQRLATEAAEASPPKTNYVRRFILTTTLATGAFYFGSAFVSFNNKTYQDFFVGKVPLGKSLVRYGEAHGWDDLTIGDVATASTEAVVTAYTFVADLLSGNKKPSEIAESVKAATVKKIEEAKSATLKAVKQTADKAEPSIQQAEAQVQKTASETKQEVEQEIKRVKEAVEKVEVTVKNVAQYETEELISRAEAAIAGKPFEPPSPAPRSNPIGGDTVPPVRDNPSTPPDVYDIPLPLGFEPPLGYTRPQPPKPMSEEKPNVQPQAQPISLPLIAPSISDASEPIITHLAGTIDNLASYLKSDSKAAEKASDILESAKGDLAALVDRIGAVKEQERTALTATLDEQTREWTLKLLEMEMEAQDKLDQQEEGFRQTFEQEKAKLIQAYREKLDHELKIQTELINER